jgi:hypothetical protein
MPTKTEQNPAAAKAAPTVKPASLPPVPHAAPAAPRSAAAAANGTLVTKLATAGNVETAIQSAIVHISRACNVTGDLALATACCKQALKWLAQATAAAESAALRA